MKEKGFLIFLLALASSLHPQIIWGNEKKLMELMAVGSLVSIGFIAFLVVMGLGLSLQILGSLFFPAMVQRALKISGTTPFRSGLLGLLNTLGMVFVFIVLGSMGHPITILMAFGLLSIFLAFFLLGLAGASLYLGNRVLALPADQRHSLLPLSIGWLLLSSLLLVPLFGWLLLAYYSFVGLGSTMLSLFHVEPQK